MTLSAYFNDHPTAKRVCAGVALAFALAGCESAQDKAAKPAVIDEMLQQSLKTCETGSINNSPTQYAQRFSTVLQSVDTADLRTIKDSGTTVCLDQRLAGQVNGFFDSEIKAIFYGNSGIVSLWDNGTQESTLFSRTSFDYGYKALDKLAADMQDKDVSRNNETYYGSKTSCGKNCTTIKWEAAADFDQDSIAKNPALKQPPLKSQPEATASKSQII